MVLTWPFSCPVPWFNVLTFICFGNILSGTRSIQENALRVQAHIATTPLTPPQRNQSRKKRTASAQHAGGKRRASSFQAGRDLEPPVLVLVLVLVLMAAAAVALGGGG
jgi:hypothetical protein